MLLKKLYKKNKNQVIRHFSPLTLAASYFPMSVNAVFVVVFNPILHKKWFHVIENPKPIKVV